MPLSEELLSHILLLSSALHASPKINYNGGQIFKFHFHLWVVGVLIKQKGHPPVSFFSLNKNAWYQSRIAYNFACSKQVIFSYMWMVSRVHGFGSLPPPGFRVITCSPTYAANGACLVFIFLKSRGYKWTNKPMVTKKNKIIFIFKKITSNLTFDIFIFNFLYIMCLTQNKD